MAEGFTACASTKAEGEAYQGASTGCVVAGPMQASDSCGRDTAESCGAKSTASSTMQRGAETRRGLPVPADATSRVQTADPRTAGAEAVEPTARALDAGSSTHASLPQMPGSYRGVLSPASTDADCPDRAHLPSNPSRSGERCDALPIMIHEKGAENPSRCRLPSMDTLLDISAPPEGAGLVPHKRTDSDDSVNSVERVDARSQDVKARPELSEAELEHTDARSERSTTPERLDMGPASGEPSQDVSPVAGVVRSRSEAGSAAAAPVKRRRNQIRESFTELSELLDTGRAYGARALGLNSGACTGVEDEELDDRTDTEEDLLLECNEEEVQRRKRNAQRRARSRAIAGRNARGRGRGRGGSAGGAGSKSAVLFQVVDMLYWLEARNAALRRDIVALESVVDQCTYY